ncbi:DNA polymerase III subunit beta [Alicyclobacillus mali]|uniref:Beta sliding clamp n=1 Tax=Alicyclobacillus mali (ex Roth et al. 2021) TaxID=1123961 RepID=A0ABS0F5D0_9BACL|nr:DNA polymerase III subunit beta [Alicyclobacillus mali (ex Roth et al. 2021)]MBF8378494.1 DNA polymerase III subunit beta [Alicyclobacillus mali (ex Roth et al. 2021)]
MRCLIEQQVLEPALSALARIAQTRAPAAVLQGVLMEAERGQVTLSAYDYDVALRMTVEASVVDPGGAVLPAKLFAELVRRLPKGTVDIATIAPHHLSASIDVGTTHAELHGFDPAEFPVLPDMTGIAPVVISAKTLVEAVESVGYAAAKQDPSRPILEGVYVGYEDGKLVWMATDGLRLAKVSQTVDREMSIRCTIPRRALTELTRLLDADDDATLQVYQSASYVMFAWDGAQLFGRLYQGEYPDTSRAMPREFAAACSVERRRLEEAIERVTILAENERHTVSLYVKEGVLELTSRSAERGHAREEVPLAEFKGDAVKIALNARYVLEMLEAVESSKVVRMQVAQDRRSALFSDESDNLHLISAILTRD